METIGTEESVLIEEVSSFQGLGVFCLERCLYPSTVFVRPAVQSGKLVADVEPSPLLSLLSLLSLGEERAPAADSVSWGACWDPETMNPFPAYHTHTSSATVFIWWITLASRLAPLFTVDCGSFSFTRQSSLCKVITMCDSD